MFGAATAVEISPTKFEDQKCWSLGPALESVRVRSVRGAGPPSPRDSGTAETVGQQAETRFHPLGGDAAVAEHQAEPDWAASSVDGQVLHGYPGFREGDANALDVGVMLFKDDIGSSIIPLLSSRDPRVGETAVVAGWGRDQSQAGSTLRAGSTTISAIASNDSPRLAIETRVPAFERALAVAVFV